MPVNYLNLIGNDVACWYFNLFNFEVLSVVSVMQSRPYNNLSSVQ